MSRYVHVDVPVLRDLEQTARGLAVLGLPVQRGRGRVMLAGSLECAGEPVDLRLPAGTLDAVEDFGFVKDGDALRLVCGELDRALLEHALLEPLRAAITVERVQQAAHDAGLELERTVDTDGRRRLVLRRRD